MVGLLGGSFDPVHHGHLIVGRVAAETLGLDSLRFVPAREQPFKRGLHGASAEQRAAMLDLAVAGSPGFAVERAELERPGPSYTVDTLRALRAREPGVRADAAPRGGRGGRARGLAPGGGDPSARDRRGVRPGRGARALLSADLQDHRGARHRDLGHRDPPAGARGPLHPLLGARSGRGVRDSASVIFGPSMIKSLMTAVLGTRHERERKRLQPVVDRIHAEEEKLKGLSEAELKAQTRKFRERLGERTGAIKAELEQVRAAKHACADPVERDGLEGRFQELEVQYKTRAEGRAGRPPSRGLSPRCARPAAGWSAPPCRSPGHELPWDMVPYDVQLIGGVVLHQGRIAEMATGEGKTLVATLPLYLNALAGRGAHLVTVNNYLARRDSQWMGHVFTLPRPHRRLPGRHRAVLARAAAPPTRPTSPTAPTTSSASTTCATTWCSRWSSGSSGSTPTRSSTRWTRSSSTRRGRRSSSRARSATRPTTSTPQFNRQVAELVRKQTGVVNSLLAEAERLLEDEKTRQDAALKLYQAHLGMPKNKRLLKMLQEHRDQAAGPAHGAGRHRGPEAADAAAADARHSRTCSTSCSTRRATRSI